MVRLISYVAGLWTLTELCCYLAFFQHVFHHNNSIAVGVVAPSRQSSRIETKRTSRRVSPQESKQNERDHDGGSGGKLDHGDLVHCHCRSFVNNCSSRYFERNFGRCEGFRVLPHSVRSNLYVGSDQKIFGG